MTSSASPVLGRPLWYELMTTDTEGGRSVLQKGRRLDDRAVRRRRAQPYTMFNRGGETSRSPA